ncbi:glycosyltransferase family 39 protein [Chloracidobacterium validum]|uniref:Glycosyltransferase family 39 protein n=1 Tax=Chloracidobacterium validum TaxID=2821543 RepID=A0ABX8B8Q8_9BACT|nr:glycosyltransferase family 39 protein [Chloracidobacterium validum]QUW03327.1 glycosyltransferase family 39 protein [Chloracidobacterium validum]
MANHVRAENAVSDGTGRLFWLGVLPLALGLRWWGIATQNLWLDELYSIDVARKPLAEIVRCAAADVHPPLFYFVLKGWMRLFGDSAAAVRSLSVVASLAALIAAFRLVAPRYGGWAALTMTLLMATSAHQVFFAQEARMYALVMALVLGAARGYAMWRETGIERGLAIYVWCSLAALYCHYFALLAILAFNAHFLLSAFGPTQAGTRRQTYRWLIAHGTMGLLYAPWVAVMLAQMRRGQTWRKPLTLGDVGWQAFGYIQETVLGYAVYLDHTREWLTRLMTEHITLPGSFFWQPLAFNVLLILWFALLTGIGLGRCLHLARTDVRAALPVMLLMLPLLIASGLSLRKGGMELGRYLLFTTPAVWFCIAVALDQVRGWQRPLALGFCVAGLFWQGTRLHYTTTARDSDVRPALAFIRQQAEPGDRVVIDPDAVDVCLAYYAPRYGLGAMIYSTQPVPTGEPNGHSQVDRLSLEREVRRAWVILDYRSERFEAPALPGFQVRQVVDFPSDYPKVRVVQVTR